MDLPALLARRPDLALIDELAHTNPPGLEHEKRYEDIADVLAAGIDVFSTVNVQHLESLNDRVAELTGVTVRETVPDSVLGIADEVVLIDLTPEALIARLRAGKIYPGENIQAALDNFFRIENLAALREVSLRQVAEDVESKRLTLHQVEPVGTREERVVDRRAQGGRRAAARPGPTAAELAAPRAARLALGPAARHRSRPALGEAAGPADRGGGGAPGDGAAPARLGARRDAADRGARRPGRRRRPGHRASAGPPTSWSASRLRRAAWRDCGRRCRRR